MIGILLIGAVESLMIAQEELREFEELCASLPKEEADKLREERKQRFAEERQHQRNLEIANARRPRNFFGK